MTQNNADADGDNTYVLMWDLHGLEQIVDAGSMQADGLFNQLRGEPSNQLGSRLFMMTMRARFNPQRNYEIYAVRTTEDIGEDDLRDMFLDDPQGAADCIRSRGVCVSSWRESTPVPVIA